MRYICVRFPDCEGSVGAHPDGKPLGSVPDPETKRLRSQLHGIVDSHWLGLKGKEKKRARGSVYRWLMALTELDVDHCHIGMLNAKQLRKLLVLVRAYPYEHRYSFYDWQLTKDAKGKTIYRKVVWKQRDPKLPTITAVIDVCPDCGKVDVNRQTHVFHCDPLGEQQRREAQEQYWD